MKEGKMKALLKGVKRLSDDEKQKAELKKQEKKSKKLNDFTPKGYKARRIGVYAFWSLFIGVFLFLGLLLLSGGPDTEEDNKEIAYDKVASQEATVFAQNFVMAYFTWDKSDEGILSRQQALAPYLVTGLDPNAGILPKSLQWNSTYLSSQIRDVNIIEAGIGQLTFEVKSKLTNGEQEQIQEQYMIVPIAYDGQSFGVYELPKFTDLEQRTTVKKVTDKRLKSATTDETNEIEAFAETFFKTYVEGEYEQLRYLLTKNNDITGLNAKMSFTELNEVEVFLNESGKGYVAYVDVTVTDPNTQIQTMMNYQLSIVKSADKFAVKAMDDLTGKSIESKSSKDLDKEAAATLQQKEQLAAQAQAEQKAKELTE